MAEMTGVFKKLVVLLRFLCMCECVCEFIIYCTSADFLCCSPIQIDSLVISAHVHVFVRMEEAPYLS